MPTTVEVPELGDVEFPDSMSHSDIIHAIDAEIMPRVRPPASLRAASSVTVPPDQGRGPDRLADVAALTPSGFPDVPGSERAVGEALESLDVPVVNVPTEVIKALPATPYIRMVFGNEAADAYEETAADLLSGLTTPKNLGIGAAAVATGPIGAAAIGSLFSIDALMKTPEQARRLGEAFGTGDRGQIAAAMTESVALGAQALGVAFVPAAIRQARRMTPRVVDADAEVIIPKTAAAGRKVAAERSGPSIDIESAARPVTPPELPAGEVRRLTPVEQALQDRVQQRLLPERIVEEAPSPVAPTPKVSATTPESLGFEKTEGFPYHVLRTSNGRIEVDFSNPSQIHIHGLGVRSAERGAGQGSALVSAVKQIADATQKPITLTAHAETPSAQTALNRFYEKLGFSKSGNDPLSGKPFYRYDPSSQPSAPEPKPAPSAVVRDTLGNEASFYSLNRLKGMQLRGDERLATALKFYGVQDIRQLSRVAERRFAERAAPKSAAPVEAAPESAPAPVVAPEVEPPAKKAEQTATPPVVEEAAKQIESVSTKRTAKAIKEDLVAQLETALAKAPEGPTDVTKLTKLEIEVPGDGTFKLFNDKPTIEKVLKAARRLSTDTGTKSKAPEARTPTGDRERLKSDVADALELYGTPEEAHQRLSSQLERAQELELDDVQTRRLTRLVEALKAQVGVEPMRPAPSISETMRRRRTQQMSPIPPGLGEEITAPSVEDVRAQRSLERRLAEANQNPDPATGAMVERVAAENPPPPMGPDVPTEGGRSGQALGIVPTFVPGPTARFVRDLLEQAVKYPLRFYSEPLIEQLARIGGPAAKEFADVARRIVALAKARIGELATQDLDAALRMAGKDIEANRWAMTIADTSKRWGYSHFIEDGLEGPIDKVPSYARDAAELYRRANSNTGRMAERDIPGFKAGGLGQREPTMFQMDLIRTGHGPGFEILVEGLATDNAMPKSVVRKILADTKAEWDKPAAEANLRTIAQEYTRQFKRYPTHLRLSIGPFGDLWVPILHANPYDYLLQTATRTAQRTAFLRFLPEERLNQYRQRIAAEGGNTAAVFDNLVRALHGLPIDEPFLRDFIPPGSPLSLGLSGANQMLSNVFAPLKLTVSALYNIPETVFGQTPRFLGWKKYMEGLWRLKELYPHLETIGAVNRAIYNDALDPQSRMRSEMRRLANGLRRTTVQVFFNEAQEALAASTAYVTTERLRNGSITKIGREEAFSTARMMGFDDAAARQIADGTASDSTYQMFVQRAAPFFTGGAMQPAEASQFANRRLLTGLFRFHNYPMMKMNALRELMSELGDAAATGSAQHKTAAATIAARYLFGMGAQGLSTTIIKAMAYGGIPALAILMSQSKDEPGEFWLDIMASDIGGPLSAIWYAQQNEGLLEAYNPEAVNAAMTFPGSMAMELTELLGGHGRFKDMDVQDRITRYFVEKIPAGRIISTVMATVGLSTEDKALDAAVRGFLEWRKENFGYKKIEDHTKADERKAFRISMGKAMRAIEDQKDPKPFLEEAVGYNKKQTGEAVANSLLARRLLFRPDRSKLTDEDLDKLIANIGLPAVEKLEAHDAMLKTLADEIRRENP